MSDQSSKCVRGVQHGRGWGSYISPCGKQASVTGSDGKPYCKTHDPDKATRKGTVQRFIAGRRWSSTSIEVWSTQCTPRKDGWHCHQFDLVSGGSGDVETPRHTDPFRYGNLLSETYTTPNEALHALLKLYAAKAEKARVAADEAVMHLEKALEEAKQLGFQP